MAQSMGLFGLNIAYGDNLRAVIKAARIQKWDKPSEFGIYTARDGGIVRIGRNGRPTGS